MMSTNVIVQDNTWKRDRKYSSLLRNLIEGLAGRGTSCQLDTVEMSQKTSQRNMQNSQKKKILYVITKSNFGGAQRYVYELATSVPKDQYDVVVAFGGSGILKEKLETARIRTISIASFQRDISLVKELRSFIELWRLYKNERPDIVHLNSSKAGGSGALIARLSGVKKIIYTAHGWAFWEPRPLLWRMLVWLASWATALLCHHIITVSQYEHTRTHVPFTRYKCTTIHTAVPSIDFLSQNDARADLSSKDQYAHHEKDLWLVTVAELNHNKNLYTAIDAVVKYNQSHTHKIFYSIIGDGELHKELDAYIQKHKAERDIVLRGHIDNARAYLKAFDLFLLPSKKEGMPYAVLEAGAAGLPVIASRVGGIPEIIEDGKNGVLIDPNDTSDVVHALHTLTESETLRTQFGTKLKAKIERDFSLTHMIDATVQLYRQ